MTQFKTRNFTFFAPRTVIFVKNVLVLKTLLIFAQKIYISYQEIYKSVHVKAKHNKLKNRRFPLIKSSC